VFTDRIDSYILYSTTGWTILKSKFRALSVRQIQYLKITHKKEIAVKGGKKNLSKCYYECTHQMDVNFPNPLAGIKQHTVCF
jgi:hypothetical protein